MGSDIRSQQHVPLVYIGRTFRHSIILNFRNAEVDLFADNILPMRHQIRLAERPGQQLPPRSVLLGINHGEDTLLGEVGETLIPSALEILGPDLVNLLERVEIRNTDFVW